MLELASMLAGEPFSDHPTSVCPVIGSFLRAYNDSVDDDRRQDLYPYASSVVGSRSSDGVERARAERLAAWAREQQRRRWTHFLPRSTQRTPTGSCGRMHTVEAAGAHAVHAIRRHTDATHAQALALIDELLALGDGSAAPSSVRSGSATSHRDSANIQVLRERHTVT